MRKQILFFIIFFICSYTNVQAACTPGAGFTLPCFNPADNATGVAINSNLVATFDAAWNNYATTKTVYIYYSNGTLWRQMAIDGAEVSGSGTVNVTVNPAVDMPYNQAMYVNFQDIYRQSGGASYSILANSTTWNFTTESDTTAPIPILFTPADNAYHVGLTDNLTILFNENIQKGGAGTIEIRTTVGASLVESFAIGSSRVTVSGATVTINPTSAFSTNTGYYVTITSGYIQDTSANNWAGVSTSTGWNFTTICNSVSGWYDCNWTHRIKLTVQSSKVNGDLTNFPVYVNLDDMPDGVFDAMRSDGADLRMTKTNGTSEVALDLVSVNATSNLGELHFQANGTLAGSSNTDFYLYFGNASVSAAPGSSAYGSEKVWTQSYRGVWHLQEDGNNTTGGYLDSTSFSIDGTGISMTTSSDVTGKLGLAQDFDGSADAINLGNNSNLNFERTNSFSISAWIYADPGVEGAVFSKMNDISPYRGYDLYISDVSDYTQVHLINTWTTNNAVKNTTFATYDPRSKWSYVSYSYDGSSSVTGIKIYYDGLLKSATTLYNNLNTTIQNSNSACIACRNSVGGFFNGKIDELRISSAVRTAQWLWTEYNNQNSTATFYTVAAVEELDLTNPTISSLSPVDNGTNISLTSNLTITFDENIDIQTGNVVIYQSNGSIFETISVTSGQVTGNGTTTITINPTSSFAGSSGYFVNIDATAFDDTSANSFAGITDNGYWSFTTISSGFDSAQWNGSVKYTIRASRIDSDLTDFPTYIDLSSFPDAFFSDVESDGADIRVTLSDQTTETAFELVSINTGTKTGELWFKAASVSSSVDTDFYIWYGKSGAVAYADTDTYGAQNVWTNGYRAVYHMNQDPSGGAGAIKDSTANEFDATAYNMTSADLVAGKVGRSINFDGSSDYMNTGTVILPTAGANWNVSFMTLPHQVNRGAANVLIEQYSDATTGRTAFQELAGDYRFYNSGSGGVTVGSAVVNKWVHLVFDYNGGTLRTYLDNVAGGTSSSLANIENTNMNFAVNDTGGDYKFDGLMDEIHISNSKRSAAWIKAVYENQYKPANFVKVAGSIPFNTDNSNTLFIYMGD